MKKCGFLMILSALVNNLYSSDLASFGTKGILFQDHSYKILKLFVFIGKVQK